MAVIKGNSGNNNLVGTPDNDSIYAYAGNDTLLGRAGDDLLDGGDGNDTLNGESGIDTLIGGKGNDTYIVDSTTDTITELSNGGTDTVQSSVSYTLAPGSYLNNLTLTGSSPINGTGNEYDNVITGNSANNILNGGAGIDTLIGGAGNDTYIVDSTTDTITELSGGGTDTVQSSVSYTLAPGSYLNNLTLTGSSPINGTGNEYDNIITGSEGTNILKGGGGNDLFDDPEFRNDTYYGGDGNDNMGRGLFYEYGFTSHSNLKMYGDAGNDYLFILSGEAYGGSGDDYLFTDEASAYGDSGNDTLVAEYYGSAYGGDGNDTLTGFRAFVDGGNGNDTLSSSYGLGDLNMTGGAGADIFPFYQPLSNGDSIADFEAADTIQVSAEGFEGGLTPGAPILEVQFTLGSSASNTSQRFIYDKFDTGALYFDVDGSGGADQRLFVTLDPGLALTRNDIFVVA